MEVESGPEKKKRLAVVSKGLTIVLKYLFNVFLPIHNSEIMAHLFYGRSHYVPKSTQLKTIKNHGPGFPKSFWAMDFEAMFVLTTVLYLCTPSTQMIMNMPS